MKNSKVFLSPTDGDSTFPNPLEIRFGDGFTSMTAFKDERDGSAGVIFSELGQQHEIGSECQEKEIYDPQSDQVAIRFFRRSSIKALIEVLSAALDDLPED